MEGNFHSCHYQRSTGGVRHAEESMRLSRKAFHFDLDNTSLEINSWNHAWSDIRFFMENHGFEHIQYSGYESVRAMSTAVAYRILVKLSKKHPLFVICAKAATLTEIGERHDVLEELAQSSQ